MNVKQKGAAILFTTTFLFACGGGGGGGGGGSTSVPAATPTEEVIEDTTDIVASRDFSFEVVDEITITISDNSNVDGALHIYTQEAFEAESGIAIGEPMSRITTIHPSTTSQVTIEVNQNWDMLYAHWVPMSASAAEQHISISLTQSNNSYHIDL